MMTYTILVTERKVVSKFFVVDANTDSEALTIAERTTIDTPITQLYYDFVIVDSRKGKIINREESNQ